MNKNTLYSINLDLQKDHIQLSFHSKASKITYHILLI